MNTVYFPSCNFTAASPEAAKRIRAYMQERMPVAGCCRTDKTDYTGSQALYFCQACRETLEMKYPEGLALENIFVWLDREEDFSWPDYSGLQVTVQDCWRDREHPEIFQAVRSCLKKMGVSVVEMAANREKSDYCGDLHFQPSKPENLALLREYPDKHLRQLPPEVFGRLMLEQAENYPVSTVVTYCNACKRGVTAAANAGWQGKGVHLLELAMHTV